MIKQGVNIHKRGTNSIVFPAAALCKTILHYVKDVYCMELTRCIFILYYQINDSAPPGCPHIHIMAIQCLKSV